MIQSDALDIVFNILADFPFDLVDIFQNATDAAIFSQQFGSSFGTHSRHTFNAIRGITHQGQIVNDLVGPHAKLFKNPIDIHWFFFKAVFQGHFVGHQLGHIFITSRNQYLMAQRFGTFSQGANDVICLSTRQHMQGNAQGTDQGM